MNNKYYEYKITTYSTMSFIKWEIKDNFAHLIIDIPGYAKENVKVSTKNGIIFIKLTKNKVEKNDCYYFPSEARFDSVVTAKVENGQLELIVELEKEKEIEVK